MYSSVKHRLHVCLVQQVVALLHKVVEVAVRSEASPQFIAGPLENQWKYCGRAACCVLGIITLCKLLWWLRILWLNNPALIPASKHNAMNTIEDWFICKKEGWWDDAHSGVKVQLFKVMSLQRENGSVVASAALRNQLTWIAWIGACNDQIDNNSLLYIVYLNPHSFQFSVSFKLKSKT